MLIPTAAVLRPQVQREIDFGHGLLSGPREGPDAVVSRRDSGCRRQ